MDINEATGGRMYRHPWELSRTGCVIREIEPYINSEKSYINVGAGDRFFDQILRRRHERMEVHAVDIGYQELTGDDGEHLYRNLDDVNVTADYGLMMDSLEYMTDDLACVRQLTEKVKSRGYVIFTLPAFSMLFSEYDNIVKNLRRYDRIEFHRLIDQVGGLEIVNEHYFYTTLFLVRFLQKYLHLTIDPEHKRTTAWPYRRRHPLTMFTQMVLDLDYTLCRILARHSVNIPGLSLLVVCRKTS